MGRRFSGREEALRCIKEKMAKDKEKYLDYQYYVKEVEVYRITFMDGSSMYIPMGIGEKVKKTMEEKSGSGVVRFGRGAWRFFEIKSLIPCVKRFVELSEWAKHKILEESPDLLAEWYSQFSPQLRENIDRIKKGDDLDDNLRVAKNA